MSTSVIAPWLQTELAGQCPNLHVVPATFAAPTAGNADFATYFQSSFGYSLRAFNSLDVAPFPWQNINAVNDIYTPCGIEVPDLVYAAAAGYNYLMGWTGVSYAQPATNQVLVFRGDVPAPHHDVYDAPRGHVGRITAGIGEPASLAVAAAEALRPARHLADHTCEALAVAAAEHAPRIIAPAE